MMNQHTPYSEASALEELQEQLRLAQKELEQVHQHLMRPSFLQVSEEDEFALLDQQQTILNKRREILQKLGPLLAHRYLVNSLGPPNPPPSRDLSSQKEPHPKKAAPPTPAPPISQGSQATEVLVQPNEPTLPPKSSTAEVTINTDAFFKLGEPLAKMKESALGSQGSNLQKMAAVALRGLAAVVKSPAPQEKTRKQHVSSPQVPNTKVSPESPEPKGKGSQIVPVKMQLLSSSPEKPSRPEDATEGGGKRTKKKRKKRKDRRNEHDISLDWRNQQRESYERFQRLPRHSSSLPLLEGETNGKQREKEAAEALRKIIATLPPLEGKSWPAVDRIAQIKTVVEAALPHLLCLPNKTQRRCLEAFQARIRTLQGSPDLFADSTLLQAHKKMRSFQKKHQPGSCYGFAKDHTPRNGSWWRDAIKHQQRLLEHLNGDSPQTGTIPKAAKTEIVSKLKGVVKDVQNNTAEQKELEDPGLPEDWGWWGKTRGRNAVMLGGNPRQHVCDAMSKSFEFKKVEWWEANKGTYKKLAKRVKTGKIQFIIITRFASHKEPQKLKKICQTEGVVRARLHQGYGPNALRSWIEKNLSPIEGIVPDVTLNKER